MIIKRINIKNFGKIHDRTMEFSPGINVLYGENESGKTTVHTFVKCMLYGVQRLRGRAAKKDTYTIYLPWDNPAVYGGTLWFESGGRNFRLFRNFHKDDQKSQLICEDDSELLDMDRGDLEAILGGVSETIYENTVSVAQLKSTTGVELVREVQNYMASYQGAGDSSVDLSRTMQMLKMNRKGFQVQAERLRKKTEQEKEKLASNMEYLQKELDDFEEQNDQLAEQERALHTGGDENGGRILDERMEEIQRKQKRRRISQMIVLAAAAVAAAGLFAFAGQAVFAVLPVISGVAAVLVLESLRQRGEEELEKRKRQKSRWMAKQEKLHWSREKLEEARREKLTALSNLSEEYQETEEHAFLPLAEELEIEALNLAMDTIQRLSRDIHRQVGGKLKRRTSQILGEITGGKYTEVLMDADLHMTVSAEGRTLPLEHLSRGTVEQVYFALRMAAGELLCGEEQFPVILDEVFGMYDEDRLASVLSWLAKENRQVIICSCRQREMELMENLGISYTKLEL